jgi:hypothetical protein
MTNERVKLNDESKRNTVSRTAFPPLNQTVPTRADIPA